MRFSLDVLPAEKGDCLVVHYGTKAEPRLMLVDGGPSGVYAPHLRPRLDTIRKARRLGEQDPLKVDVLLVSHVDDDHIKGILDMTKELRRQRVNRQPRFVQVRTIWHNCFDDLLTTQPGELEAHASFGAAALSGDIDVPDGADFDVAKVLASIPQGRTLRDDAQFLREGGDGWRVNAQFGGGLILAASDVQPVRLPGNVTCTVLGPMRPELEALQEEHDQWLRAQKKPQASSALAAFVDRSITNLSSIVLLVEAGGKRMLLTGDARGDKILEGLTLSGLLPTPTSTLHVDLLKVPHHGSSNNMETSFFQRVTADHYVFSGNGEHGNPERETLEMLFEARGSAPFTLCLTYPIDSIDVEREKEWKKQQANERAKGRPPRPNWSPPINSLRAFLDGHPLVAGQRIVEIPEASNSHYVIDLLDPVGV